MTSAAPPKYLISFHTSRRKPSRADPKRAMIEDRYILQPCTYISKVGDYRNKYRMRTYCIINRRTQWQWLSKQVTTNNKPDQRKLGREARRAALLSNSQASSWRRSRATSDRRSRWSRIFLACTESKGKLAAVRSMAERQRERSASAVALARAFASVRGASSSSWISSTRTMHTEVRRNWRE